MDWALLVVIRKNHTGKGQSERVKDVYGVYEGFKDNRRHNLTFSKSILFIAESMPFTTFPIL